MIVRVDVTDRHYNEGDADSHNCMVALALKDAGFSDVCIDLTADIGPSKDLSMPLSLLRKMDAFDSLDENGNEYPKPTPFFFEVVVVDNQVVKIGEAQEISHRERVSVRSR